jgi:hypothetical protein
MVAINRIPYTTDTHWWSNPYILATSIDTEMECDNQFKSTWVMTSNALDYTMVITGAYTFPENFVRFQVEMTIPDGGTGDVIFYSHSEGQSSYNGDTVTRSNAPFYAASPVVAIGSRNVNDGAGITAEDAHFTSLFAHVSGLPFTGYAFATDMCGVEKSSCMSSDNRKVGIPTGQDLHTTQRGAYTGTPSFCTPSRSITHTVTL